MSERTAVYRLYDASDVLLYVGISRNLSLRWQQHRQKKPWWPEVHRKTITWYDSRQEADEAETAAITAEKPLHNKAKVPWSGDLAIMAMLDAVRDDDAAEQLRRARRRRQAAVMDARAHGWSKYKIAATLGVSGTTVDAIISAAERQD